MANTTIYKNNVAGTLAANIGPSDTAILLGAGQGASFPTPTAGDYFFATVVHIATGLIEIVRCTARSVDTLTVERGRDGTAAISFTTGSVIEMRLCALMLQEIDYRPLRAAANGLASLDAGGKIPDSQIPASITRDSELALYIPLAQRAAANGVATLDAGIKIPVAQIPALPYIATVGDGVITGSLAVSGLVDAGTEVRALQNFAARSATAVLAPTGAGTVLLRPNGVASATGQAALSAAGLFTVPSITTSANASVGGTLTVTGVFNGSSAVRSSQNFESTSANVVLAPTGAGTVFLRPNGSASAVGQATLAASGVLTAVNLIATSDRRKKKHIQKEVARDNLADQLPLKSWRMRADNLPGRGVVAQDVMKYAPEYVCDTGGVLGVDKAGLALEAVLGLASRVRQLEKAHTCSTSKRSTTRSNSSAARR